MTESEFPIIKIKNPLSEETRKERWHLLLISAVSITIVKTGLIPTKISALGIEFSQTNQRTLLNILIAITVYFALAFVIYALSDFWTYRIGTYIDEVKYATELTFELNESIKKQEEKIIQLKSLSQNISEIKNKENEIFDEAKKDFKTQKPYFQDLFDAVEGLSKTEGKGEHDEKERKKIADVLNTIKPLVMSP